MAEESRRTIDKRLSTWLAAGKNRMTLGAGLVAGLVLFIMATTITGDVILRYVFNAPTKWVDEVATYLMMVAVFLGLAHAQRERAHIRVSILVTRLPKAVQPWLHLITLVIFFGYTIILFYLTGIDFLISLKWGSLSASLLQLPIAPWQAFMPIGLLVLAVVLIWDIYAEVVRIRHRKYESGEAQKSPQEGS